jgi:hypothetical protein
MFNPGMVDEGTLYMSLMPQIPMMGGSDRLIWYGRSSVPRVGESGRVSETSDNGRSLGRVGEPSTRGQQNLLVTGVGDWSTRSADIPKGSREIEREIKFESCPVSRRGSWTGTP